MPHSSQPLQPRSGGVGGKSRNLQELEDNSFDGFTSNDISYSQVKVNKFTEQATATSSDNFCQIILIKPISDSLIYNPIKIAQSIENSPFKKYNKKKIKINKRKNLIVLELGSMQREEITKLLETRRI